MKNINQLKKEIEEYHKKKKEEGMDYFHRDKKIPNRVMKAKLQTLQEVCEEIDKTYKDLDMGKTIPIFIQKLKQKFQGDENNN